MTMFVRIEGEFAIVHEVDKITDGAYA